MKIFARPNKAFHDYECSLLRPRSWPPTAHDVPTLWDRARELFAVMLATILSAADLASRVILSRKQRRDLIARLVPIEKLVRLLMLSEAAHWLVNDPKGQHLRATTKTMQPSLACAAPQLARRLIPMPGWHTIAALHPRLDPRVEERRARARAAIDPFDPAAWDCRFQMPRWHAFDPASPDFASLDLGSPDSGSLDSGDAEQASSRPGAVMAEYDAYFPMLPESPRRLSALARDDNAAPPLDLARRIEALSRILANPLAAIRRLARRLASLPADFLEMPRLANEKLDTWWHGVPETWNACDHAQRAMSKFMALVCPWFRKLEPG